MSDPQVAGHSGRRLSPNDINTVILERGSVLRPGYNEASVDGFLRRVAAEVGRLIAEKAELRDEVNALRQQLDGVATPVSPSEQAVRILSVAQQTADNYVAEAEGLSRNMTIEARVRYEEQVRLARENAGAIIQAAQEAAAKITAGRDGDTSGSDTRRSAEELEEQVAYLKTFATACRVQLRAYLEALLCDVESEWGKADPAALPPGERPLALRPGSGNGTSPAHRANGDRDAGSELDDFDEVMAAAVQS
ncbi:DivIVA domain-containing protein [Blastococcus sp. SYSU D00669]